MATDILRKISREESATKSSFKGPVQLPDGSVEEDCLCQNLSEGCHGLPHFPMERSGQSVDQPIASKPESIFCQKSAFHDRDEAFMSSETYSKSRKHALIDEGIPEPRKRLRLEQQSLASDKAVAKETSFSRAYLQQKAEESWESVKVFARAELLSELQMPETQIPFDDRWTSINDATKIIRQLVGEESIKQVQALRKEYAAMTPQCAVQWPRLLQPPVAGNVVALMQCYRQYARSTTAFDHFGENLARSELHRAGFGMTSLNLHPAAVEIQNEQIREGEKLRVLADAFGIGILALIPRQSHTP